MQTGRAAYENAYSAQSVETFKITDNVADLKVSNPELVKPEQVTSIEVGYRGKIDKLVVDFSAYYNSYKDFISQEVVDAPFYGIAGDGNLSIDAIRNDDIQRYSAYTNTDADVNSYGASIGLDLAYRFSDDYFWEATFGNGVVPEFHTLDAQISYTVPSIKSSFKLGGTNITGKEYFTAFGTGFIGSMYYLSWTINN